jgi:cation diffusion facilitator CzcD-associated flavoprotein CzcO
VGLRPNRKVLLVHQLLSAWNRYPGARCDVESLDYSYSFSPEIEQEWNWTELTASQPEIERYLNYVADKLDLRRDISFETRVTALTFDAECAPWRVDTDGRLIVATFVVAATGCLSAPLEPARHPGHRRVRRHVAVHQPLPQRGFDFTGARVAVIGTGSSGVQSIPVIAEVAEHLFVLQRSAAYSVPSGNRPYEAGEFEQAKADYPEIRAQAKASALGTTHFGGALGGYPLPDQRILDATEEERWAEVEEWGWRGFNRWSDVPLSMEANEVAADVRRAGRRRGRGPGHRRVPRAPLSGGVQGPDRRPWLLRDVQPRQRDARRPAEGRHRGDRARGDRHRAGHLRSGRDPLRDRLRRDDGRAQPGPDHGPRRTDAARPVGRGRCRRLSRSPGRGVPQFFTVTGPGSPSVLANVVAAIEQHVDWIGDCLSYVREHGWRTIEADVHAQAEWVEHA